MTDFNREVIRRLKWDEMYGPKQALPICLAVLAVIFLVGTFQSGYSRGFGTSLAVTRGDEIRGIPPFNDDSVRIYIGVVKHTYLWTELMVGEWVLELRIATYSAGSVCPLHVTPWFNRSRHSSIRPGETAADRSWNVDLIEMGK